jgi:hypothetical protein
MKAISIQQPWAWAIIHGGKDIENRNWRTKHRGPVLIHASKTYDHEGHRHIVDILGISIPEDLPRGGIAGIVFITDCVEASSSRWFTGKYGFALKNARELPFTPYRGMPGLFDADVENLREER